MAKIEIDNKKMWEYLLNNIDEPKIIVCIQEALEEQGLSIDDDGHIISIMPQNEDFKFEKGKYYVYIGENCKYFTNKKSYQVIMDSYEDDYNICFIDNVGDRHPWSQKAAFMSFRPSTEEEIKGAEPRQENSPILSNSSNTGENELTEFENAIGLEIFDPPFNNEQIAIIKKESKEILLIAYRQFLSERYHNAAHYNLAEILANRFKSSFSDSGCNEEDFKIFAAQDAEVAMVFCRKEIASEIQELITFHLGHAQSDVGTTAVDGLEEALKKIKEG